MGLKIENVRKTRIEEYRRMSGYADELVDIKKTSDALKIIEAGRAQAAAFGDEDYRLFFEAEQIVYQSQDIPTQLKLIDQALEWQEAQQEEADFFLYRTKAVYYSLNEEFDKAIEWFDKALAENPKDWLTMRQKGVSISKKGELDAAIEWYDKALAENPKDWRTMWQKGVAFSNKGEWDTAIEWFDKALVENPRDWDSMREKGVTFSGKGEFDVAIDWFDKALAENPRDWHAMRNKGTVLSNKGELDAAIEWYNKALAENPRDWRTMRNKGISLSKKGDDAAIEWFNKALEINPKDINSLRGRSVYFTRKGKFHIALEELIRAIQINKNKYLDDFRVLCEICNKQPEEEWKKLFPEEPLAPWRSELSNFIYLLRNCLGDSSARFLEQKKEAEAKRKKFLDHKSCLDAERSIFMVLRKWNSYTPAIPSAEDERSRGGGYFIWHHGHGTVIDPGYNFIENFNEAGCRICDIDNIIITHAHNDHTIEFETLRTLLHEYNDNIRKHNKKLEQDEKRSEETPLPEKKIRLFLNNGAFIKFSGMINLQDKDFTDHVYTLNPGGQFELKGNPSDQPIRLHVLSAYHDELVARDQSIGLLLIVPAGASESRKLIFTGDTGLFPLRTDVNELQPDIEGVEVWMGYQEALRQNDATGNSTTATLTTKESAEVHPDLMVIHIGSIKEEELSPEFSDNPKTACYPNHLGIIGSSRLITMCRPHLAVISEFGEEMKEFRKELIQGIQEQIINLYFKNAPQPHIPRVIPGDLPFIYDIAKREFFCCLNMGWQRVEDIAFNEHIRGRAERTIYYHTKSNKKDPVTDHIADRFNNVRHDFDIRMYFHPEAIHR